MPEKIVLKDTPEVRRVLEASAAAAERVASWPAWKRGEDVPATGRPPLPKEESPVKDMKEALSSGRKPDITHIRTPLLVYGARACEYGSDRYERANYLRATDGTKADFLRLRAYLGAALRHVSAVVDSMEAHQAGDPQLDDVEGMKRAAYAEDTDAPPSGKVGPSLLPHLCGAVASLNMAITQATAAGLLPADPGQPWAAQPTLKLPERVWNAPLVGLDSSVTRGRCDKEGCLRRAMHRGACTPERHARAVARAELAKQALQTKPPAPAPEKPKYIVVQALDVPIGKPRYYATKNTADKIAAAWNQSGAYCGIYPCDRTTRFSPADAHVHAVIAASEAP